MRQDLKVVRNLAPALHSAEGNFSNFKCLLVLSLKVLIVIRVEVSSISVLWQQSVAVVRNLHTKFQLSICIQRASRSCSCIYSGRGDKYFLFLFNTSPAMDTYPNVQHHYCWDQVIKFGPGCEHEAFGVCSMVVGENTKKWILYPFFIFWNFKYINDM